MIWIVGGTKDSREIFEKLAEEPGISILVSTATEYGGKLLEEYIEKNSIIISDEEKESQKKREEKFDDIDSILNNLID